MHERHFVVKVCHNNNNSTGGRLKIIILLLTCAAVAASSVYYIQQKKTKACIQLASKGENFPLTKECQWTPECAEIQSIIVNNTDAPTAYLQPAQDYFLGHCLGHRGAVAAMNIDKHHLPELVASVQEHMQWNEQCANNKISKKLYNSLYKCGIEVNE